MSILTFFARFFLKNREKSISDFKANAKKNQKEIKAFDANKCKSIPPSHLTKTAPWGLLTE